MAINRGVLGTQTGSMGGITASNWKGRNVYKQKVPATNSSNTPAQQLQRRKFAALAVLAGLFGSSIRVGFRGAAAKVTEQNAFTSANFDAVSDDGTVATVDLQMLKLSTGIVGPVANLVADYTAGTGSTLISYTDNSNGADALPSDLFYGMAYNEVTGFSKSFSGGAVRSQGGGFAVQLPAGMNAADIVVYGFFKRATTVQTSPSTVVTAS